ncbi:hypothetical protein A33M_0774 [Rhodovulum sp. PH10]|nr:hypothetical protein A33M_0774 [Rhodovulum sp. PH10]
MAVEGAGNRRPPLPSREEAGPVRLGPNARHSGHRRGSRPIPCCAFPISTCYRASQTAARHHRLMRIPRCGKAIAAVRDGGFGGAFGTAPDPGAVQKCRAGMPNRWISIFAISAPSPRWSPRGR